MGIEKREFYVVSCDRCDGTLDTEQGIIAFDNEAKAKEFAENSGWIIEADGQIVCTECNWDEINWERTHKKDLDEYDLEDID